MTTVLRDPVVLAALGAGLLLRLVQLAAAPLWLDEVATTEWIGLPWPVFLERLTWDNHPPLYFVALKLVQDLFGSGTWTLRLPSALAGALVVPFGAAAAATLSGRAAGRWAAWLLALSPVLVHHSQEARMYALVGTLAAANLFALARWTTGRRDRLGGLFAATAAALVATHYYAMFYVAGAGLVAVLARPREIRGWLPAVGVAALATLGALALAVGLAAPQAGGRYELGWFVAPGALWALIAGYTFLPDTFALHADGGRAAMRHLPVALAAAPVVLAVLWFALRATSRTSRLTLLVPLLPALVVPLLAPLFLRVPVNPRYFIAIVPAIFVFFAAGLAWSGAGRTFARAAGLALGCLLAVATARHLADPGHGREDTAAAAAWLEEHAPGDQPILVTSREMAYLARTVWADREIVDYPDPYLVLDAATAEEVAEAMPWHGDRTIYVFGRTWIVDPDGALETTLSRRWSSCGHVAVRGMRVHCFERRREARRP